ncbi:uncharacterized protein K452DRAFT_302896 [Aplosporella prunicola CBS 121167]|uniref:C3H1-type domain-containing protein n=1 Tax=Aplosporella prunicola CBS 121167 TaxID=1176127 RepID=A0A6A6AWD5_9PEZI|nr:uncharacterized protein K452DRAFT_302896 [Aplosporella prunicola CBS 121167]KAF2136249.1 hypothetical protein K452DRAFT_302896 [Aplosporella prunicola CBS 121167]
MERRYSDHYRPRYGDAEQGRQNAERDNRYAAALANLPAQAQYQPASPLPQQFAPYSPFPNYPGYTQVFGQGYEQGARDTARYQFPPPPQPSLPLRDYPDYDRAPYKHDTRDPSRRMKDEPYRDRRSMPPPGSRHGTWLPTDPGHDRLHFRGPRRMSHYEERTRDNFCSPPRSHTIGRPLRDRTRSPPRGFRADTEVSFLGAARRNQKTVARSKEKSQDAIARDKARTAKEHAMAMGKQKPARERKSTLWREIAEPWAKGLNLCYLHFRTKVGCRGRSKECPKIHSIRYLTPEEQQRIPEAEKKLMLAQVKARIEAENKNAKIKKEREEIEKTFSQAANGQHDGGRATDGECLQTMDEAMNNPKEAWKTVVQTCLTYDKAFFRECAEEHAEYAALQAARQAQLEAELAAYVAQPYVPEQQPQVLLSVYYLYGYSPYQQLVPQQQQYEQQQPLPYEHHRGHTGQYQPQQQQQQQPYGQHGGHAQRQHPYEQHRGNVP